MQSSDGPHLQQPKYASVRDRFAQELVLSLKGEKTSLPFIKNPFISRCLVNDGDLFQVFVIGGTNGSTALLEKTSDGVTIISQKSLSIETLFATANDFFAFIETYLDSRVSVIGINFAFGLLPCIGENGILDGSMIGGDEKGHAFAGLQNEPVGSLITKYFAAKQKTITVSVANDSICLLLAGLTKRVDKKSVVAGIVGTGCNLAFFSDEHTMVNIQSSDFSGFTPTDSGSFVDEHSLNPGKQLFAKEVAAGELYKHFAFLSASWLIKDVRVSSSKDLTTLARTRTDASGRLAIELLKRSASLIASQVAGLYFIKERPLVMTILMEGSLFWEGFEYKTFVEHELEALGVPKDAIVFTRMVNTDVIGASKLIVGGC